MRFFGGILFVPLLLGITSNPAHAQAFRIGPSITAMTGVVRGSSVAYDYVDNMYLVVSAHGNLNGRFISADGTLLGQIAIQSAAAGFSQYPGVAYSPDAFDGAGGFLVAWHQSLAVGAVVHARMVSTTGVLGPESQPRDPGGKQPRISPTPPQARNSSSSGRQRASAHSESGIAAKCWAAISR